MRVLRVRGFALLLVGQAVSEIGQLDRGHRDLGLRVVPVRRRAPATSRCSSSCSRCRARCSARCSVCRSTGWVRAARCSSPTCSAWSTRSRSPQANSYTTIILLALPLGLIEAMATASLDAIPPRLVPDDQLVTANALLGGAQDLAIVVGPLAAARGERAVGPRGRVPRRRRDVPRRGAGRAAASASIRCRVSRTSTPRRPGASCATGSRWPAAPRACAGPWPSRAACTCSGRCSACSSRCTSATCSAGPTRCSRCSRPCSASGSCSPGWCSPSSASASRGRATSRSR